MPNKKLCKNCDNTGWVYKEGSRAVERCECFYSNRKELLLKQAGIPERYKNCRIKNFNVYTRRDGKVTVNRAISVPCEFAKKFVANYPNVEKGILFTGQCGIGKTHLAVAILMEILLTKGASVRFYDWRELMKSIQSSYSVDGVSVNDVLRPAVTCDVLCLDEVVVKKVSDFFLDTLNVLINKRYNQKKITIITSNWVDNPKVPTEVSLADKIGYNLRSRLYEMCHVFELQGKDYRVEGQKKIF